jgi:hypothetical protein
VGGVATDNCACDTLVSDRCNFASDGRAGDKRYIPSVESCNVQVVEIALKATFIVGCKIEVNVRRLCCVEELPARGPIRRMREERRGAL